jgi:hypothetical protein
VRGRLSACDPNFSLNFFEILGPFRNAPDGFSAKGLPDLVQPDKMSLLKSVLTKGSMPPPPVPSKGGNREEFHASDWRAYFTERKEVTLADNEVNVTNEQTFCVYSVGSEGPIVFLLHGAGYSALTWALAAVFRELTIRSDWLRNAHAV